MVIMKRDLYGKLPKITYEIEPGTRIKNGCTIVGHPSGEIFFVYGQDAYYNEKEVTINRKIEATSTPASSLMILVKDENIALKMAGVATILDEDGFHIFPPTSFSIEDKKFDIQHISFRGVDSAGIVVGSTVVAGGIVKNQMTPRISPQMHVASALSALVGTDKKPETPEELAEMTLSSEIGYIEFQLIEGEYEGLEHTMEFPDMVAPRGFDKRIILQGGELFIGDSGDEKRKITVDDIPKPDNPIDEVLIPRIRIDSEVPFTVYAILDEEFTPRIDYVLVMATPLGTVEYEDKSSMQTLEYSSPRIKINIFPDENKLQGARQASIDFRSFFTANNMDSFTKYPLVYRFAFMGYKFMTSVHKNVMNIYIPSTFIEDLMFYPNRIPAL